MTISTLRRLLAVAVLGGLTLTLSGCGGGDEGAVINFPESDTKPVLTDTSKDAGAQSGMSQGDPSQYTQ